jgi:hypothetical protein
MPNIISMQSSFLRAAFESSFKLQRRYEGQAKIEGVKTYKSGFTERLISFGLFCGGILRLFEVLESRHPI